jgi:hypothetical protein
LKNGNIILSLIIFLAGLQIAPVEINARNLQAEMSASVSARPIKSGISRLHEFSQTSLRSKTLKGKKVHHHGQRPDDPFSIHHARPFFVMTFQEEDSHAVLTSSFGSDTPIYIGRLHPSDHISRIFHPPAV